MPQVLRRLICLILSIGALLAVGSGRSDASGPREKLDFVLDGMARERQLLRSGQCRMKGRTAEMDLTNPQHDLSGELEIFLAFDGETKIRFDRKGPGWEIDSASIRPDPRVPQGVQAQSKKGTVDAKYYRTGRRSGYWIAGTPVIQVNRPNFEPPKDTVGLFDVRALGLYSWIELQRGYTLAKLIEHYRQPGAEVSVNDADPEEWLLTWSHRGERDELEWRLWVKVTQGFTPVRAEQRQRGGRAGQSDWTVLQSFQTKWDRVGDVWVPVSHEMVVAPEGKKLRWERSFTITWDLVNKPVREELFDYKTFGAPASVGVTDSSLGQPVIVRPFQPPPGLQLPRKQSQGKGSE